MRRELASCTPIKGSCPPNKSAAVAAAARSGVSVRRFTTPADTNKRPRLRPAEWRRPNRYRMASPLAGLMTAAGRPLGLSYILDRVYRMFKMLAAIHELCWRCAGDARLRVTSWVAFEFWFAPETPAALIRPPQI